MIRGDKREKRSNVFDQALSRLTADGRATADDRSGIAMMIGSLNAGGAERQGDYFATIAQLHVARQRLGHLDDVVV